MTPLDGLLQAVLAEPDADGPRLVLADWWEENGQPERAEFVRVQCRIAALLGQVQRWVHTPHDQPGGSAEDGGPAGAALAEAQALQRRERELLKAHWREWYTPWKTPIIGCTNTGGDGDNTVTFRRGFVSEVRCRLADFEEHGPALVKACPLEVVRVVDREPYRHNNGVFSWFSTRNGWTANMEWVLPDGVFDCLPVRGVLRGVMMMFSTRQASKAALERHALIRWAKDANRTPAPPPPGPPAL